MKVENFEQQYKAEKINMLWIFTFGIFALMWVTYSMNPQRMRFSSKETTGVSQSQLRNRPEDAKGMTNKTEYQSLPNPFPAQE